MDQYFKIKKIMENLVKNEPALVDSLDENYTTKNLPKHLYKDTLADKLGNKYSWNEFKNANLNSGIVLVIDINGFDDINEQFGAQTGNESLKAFGDKLADLASKSGVKAFRYSGGTFLVHAPNADVGERFKQVLMQTMNSMPKVNGKHKISVSVGSGYNFDHANKALKHAKGKLNQDNGGINQRIKPFGAEDNVEQSLLHDVPTFEWTSMPGYNSLAPHEELSPLIDNAVKSPLKSDKS